MTCSTSRRSTVGAGSAALVALALALLLPACSESSASDPTSPPTTVPAGAVPSSTPDTPAAPATSPPAPVDPVATLQTGLDGLGSSYHFTSTVTIDGAVALVAEGDRIGDGSRLTLTNSNGAISYVIAPEGSWAMPEGGAWQRLDDDPADVDTIAALRAPTAVRLDRADAAGERLTVTVPNASLGLAGDGTADLAVVVVAGAVQAISYTSTLDGRPAAVTSTFGPPQDPSPVMPPV